MPEFNDDERTFILLALWQWMRTDPTLNAEDPTWEEDEAAWGMRRILRATVEKLGGRFDAVGFGIGQAESN